MKSLAVIAGIATITLSLYAVAASHRRAQQIRRDAAAVEWADRVAVNLRRYADRHAGAYPPNISGYWPGIMVKLRPDNDWPAKPPPFIFKAWAGDEGENIQGYSDGEGSIYQLLFRAAGGTGKVYCRDPKGTTSVAPALLGKPGPWDGCP